MASQSQMNKFNSDVDRVLPAELAVQLDSFVQVGCEDLGHRPILRPRLPSVGLEEKLVVELEEVLQAALGRSLGRRVLKSEVPELLVDFGVEVVEQHLRPELVELLHLLGSVARLGILPLLKRRVADFRIRFAACLLLGGGRRLSVNPNDPAFGLGASCLPIGTTKRLESFRATLWTKAGFGLVMVFTWEPHASWLRHRFVQSDESPTHSLPHRQHPTSRHYPSRQS